MALLKSFKNCLMAVADEAIEKYPQKKTSAAIEKVGIASVKGI